MRIIDRFSSEHDVFLEQLEVIERLVRADAPALQVVAAMRTLAAPLLAHAENEERALFPDLEPTMGGEGGPLAMLTEEHATIHGQVDELTSDPAAHRIPDLLDEFQGLLRAHIEKEEQVLFPAAAQILGDDRLARLDRDLERTAAA